MLEEQNNKLSGMRFEKRFAKLASDHGWWSHVMQDNENGQPADVIMTKNGIPVLVDCKVCEHNTFPLDRMRENQEYAMSLWRQTGNLHAVFALDIRGEVRIINFATLFSAKYGQGLKQLNYNQIMARSLPFLVWEALVCRSQ